MLTRPLSRNHHQPFLKNSVNPSWTIAHSLPATLPPTATAPYRIRIAVPAAPLRTSYAHVSTAAPALLAEHAGGVSAVVHLGLADKRTSFGLERRSDSGPYARVPDVDGHMLEPEEAARLFEGLPHELRPSFHCEDVWRRWRDNVPDQKVDLRPSDDPGSYLCAFVYYLSMAWFYRRGEDRPVVFCHLPNLLSEEEVETGVDVVVALIYALVTSREKIGLKDQVATKRMEGVAPNEL
jgi:pyroglutamyl-peptidase